MQFAETAKKQSFQALCGLQPLVKTYRDKIEETSQAMIQTESSLDEDEVPEAYAAALALVKESFADHLGALEELMAALTQKNESRAEAAMSKVKQSGDQLGNTLEGLSIPR